MTPHWLHPVLWWAHVYLIICTKNLAKKYEKIVSWVSVPFPEATGRLRWHVGKHSRGRVDKNLWIGSSFKLQQACEGKIQFILACPFTSKHLKPQILDSGSKGTKKISLTDWWTKQQESLQDAKKQKIKSIRSSSFLTQLQHSPGRFLKQLQKNANLRKIQRNRREQPNGKSFKTKANQLQHG